MNRLLTPLLFFLFLGPLYAEKPESVAAPQAEKSLAPPKSVAASPPQKVLGPIDEVIKTQGDAEDNHFANEFIRMLTTLGLILAALIFVSWFMKRFMNTRIQQMNDASSIKIVERRAISPKTSIYLIEIGNTQMTVAESQNGVTLLDSSKVRSKDDRIPFPPT